MKSDMENNEWADEEMSLKQVNKNNPFTVPVGYFEESSQRILSLIELEEKKGSDASHGFSIPDNYFDTLNANIQSRINIGKTVTKQQPDFAIPANYFEQLSNNIQSRINIETALNTETSGFTVPQNYFKDLEQQIRSRITVEEILVNTGEFTVPDNYFEKLNRSILNQTVNKGALVRKTVVRKLFASNTFKYATAACLALIIGAGVFLRQTNGPAAHSKTYLHTQLSEVPVDEIKNYLELHIDANETQSMMENQKINTQALDEDLQDYIDINQ